MKVRMEKSWLEILKDEFAKPYFPELVTFLKKEYREKIIYPPAGMIFRALDLCPFDKVKVVIIGQDPYHGKGQANGLCFAVWENLNLPPSLVNIHKEIQNDLGLEVNSKANRGDLSFWAKQGVLLLNSVLTVRAGQAGSHQNKGWEKFTDAVIAKLNEKKKGVVFLLWGSYARNKGALIDRKKHLVLEATHPSPFSAHSGFFGCAHFSKTNAYLKARSEREIVWN